MNSDTEVTRLFRAIGMYDCQYVRQYIAAGKDVNVSNYQGLTPLHGAAASGCTRSMKMLIAAGAQVNSTSGTLETPLHVACDYEQALVVRILLVAGADTSMTDNEGRTPLALILNSQAHDIEKLLRAAEETEK